MNMILRHFSDQLVFWMAWIIIPLVMEIIPAVYCFIMIINKKFFTVKDELEPVRFPEVTIVIPVFNSVETLFGCVESVWLSDYPKECISIIMVNNKTTDNSFEEFKKCQDLFRKLPMQWLNAEQGKSKALNLAMFNSRGKYIIQIDSDGKLHPKAIANIVKKFENNLDVYALTGAVLTDTKMIDQTEGFMLRLFRKTEFFEYCQAFLAGRNYQSEINSLYTLSGACSAFRRSGILKTQLYNTDTVSEDTHLTFQMRKIANKKVLLCENAFFMVDPIENFEKLYTQRQRWQQGQIEVSHLFLNKELNTPKGFINNFVIRILMYDHTFAFPRMIWYFALFYLTFLNYPMGLVIGSVIFIYILYVISSFLYYINVCSYFKEFKELSTYYRSKWYLAFILPIYSFVVFWIRLSGIINCIKRETHWRTLSFREEKEIVLKIIASDFFLINRMRNKMKSWVEKKAQ